MADRAEVSALDVVVATRDASWFDHPSTDRPIVYHVVVEGYVSACMGLPLVAESESTPHDIDSALYCRRRACVNRWVPAVEARMEKISLVEFSQREAAKSVGIGPVHPLSAPYPRSARTEALAYRCPFCRAWNNECTRVRPCRGRAFSSWLRWVTR